MAESAAKFLETERMYFRRFVADDAPLLFELDSDPEVMRYFTKGKPTSMAEIQGQVLPRFLDYYNESPPRGFWAAHLRETGEFIGWFHLRPGKIPSETDVGYRLKRSVWGRGLATEGSLALIKKAFNDWGYQKVTAHTMAANLASRRVMEKSGLTFEQEFFYRVGMSNWITGDEHRSVRYSITREQFLRQSP